MQIKLTSMLTCPMCGFRESLSMPTDACIYFHECSNCSEMLKPKPGDCCVFCSYADTPCPPRQGGDPCCDG
ncbi:MAG: GDCCVxC domain-containing (seleno)protein [Rhodospirillales bacterium]